jgi:transposase InsO family protein
VGLPQQIKTDNGPGYTSKVFLDFYATLEIVHVTGVPYSPQGQAIIERAHLILKKHH